jgi:hypothetical protein
MKRGRPEEENKAEEEWQAIGREAGLRQRDRPETERQA